MISQTIRCSFQKAGEEHKAKNNDGVKMVVVFTITEINYLVVGYCTA